MGLWPFDEGAGTFTTDLSPSGADGTLVGPVWQSDTVDGSDFSLDFDGVDDRVDVGVIDIVGNEMSLAAWFRVDDFDVLDGRLISKARDVFDADHYWMLSTLQQGGAFRLRFRLMAGGATNTLIATDGDLVIGEWIHVAAVYDGAEMRLYKDGVLVGSRPKSGAIDMNPAVAVAIGNQPFGAGTRPFDGSIDDVRVYDRVLSEAEITQLSTPWFPDCNANLLDDALDISTGASLDCNANGVPDECDVAAATSLDCNANGLPDECEPDCNANGVPDDCDVAGGSSPDCDSNGLPDECDIAAGAADCNANGIPDSCDVASGTSLDCNANGLPDECEPDCNTNGVPDDCDIASGTSQDCNSNGLPDECDIASGAEADCDLDGVPDSCELASGAELDCNTNGVPDACDITSGTSLDADVNGVPDECEVDCNGNGVFDPIDLAMGTSPDCNANSVPG